MKRTHVPIGVARSRPGIVESTTFIVGLVFGVGSVFGILGGIVAPDASLWGVVASAAMFLLSLLAICIAEAVCQLRRIARGIEAIEQPSASRGDPSAR